MEARTPRRGLISPAARRDNGVGQVCPRIGDPDETTIGDSVRRSPRCPRVASSIDVIVGGPSRGSSAFPIPANIRNVQTAIPNCLVSQAARRCKESERLIAYSDDGIGLIRS